MNLRLHAAVEQVGLLKSTKGQSTIFCGLSKLLIVCKLRLVRQNCTIKKILSNVLYVKICFTKVGQQPLSTSLGPLLASIPGICYLPTVPLLSAVYNLCHSVPCSDTGQEEHVVH